MKPGLVEFLKFSFVLTILLALTACQLTRPASGRLALSAQPNISIQETITVPASVTRVFIQSGKVVPTFSDYQTNCNLEVRRLDSDAEQTILPATYQITGKTEFQEWVVEHRSKNSVHVASADDRIAAAIFFEDNSSDVYRTVHFYLSGPDANLMRLTCRGTFASPSVAQLPTKSEIIETLGDLITINF